MKKRFIVMTVDEAREKYGDHKVQGWDKSDICNVIIDTKYNLIVGCDGGAPEDQTLDRFWIWVPELLNEMAEEHENEYRSLLDSVGNGD